MSASSRTGLVRSNNEDMILVADRFIRNDSYSTEIDMSQTSRFVIALADGMGGCNAGEVASADTLENLRFFISDLPDGLTGSGFMGLMNGWLESINKIISSKGHVDSRLSNMGTTLVALVCYDGKFFRMNCGDSRLYRLREGTLEQLTVDHSLNVAMCVEKHSHVLTNCIGAGCETSYLEVTELSSDIQSGDVYMLCSDGLNDMISDREISDLLADGRDAGALCDAAIEAGGYDNVSVCVLMVM